MVVLDKHAEAYEELKDAATSMLAAEFKITARPFQVESIARLVYASYCGNSERLLLVQKTGNGKSCVPLGTLMMLGGVAIVVVPFHSVGTGQAAAARRCANIESVYWDELDAQGRAATILRFGCIQDRAPHLADMRVAFLP